jgi:hypothetical protein
LNAPTQRMTSTPLQSVAIFSACGRTDSPSSEPSNGTNIFSYIFSAFNYGFFPILAISSSSTLALLCSVSLAAYTRVTLSFAANLAIRFRSAAFEGSDSSPAYFRLNSGHLSGSWANHLRKSSLGATSFIHSSMPASIERSPRGHSLSTSILTPSVAPLLSYTLFTFSMLIYPSRL